MATRQIESHIFCEKINVSLAYNHHHFLAVNTGKSSSTFLTKQIMDQLLKKLNVKEQKELVTLNAPYTVTNIIKSWSTDLKISTTLPESANSVTFVIAFVQTQEQINSLIPLINNVLIQDGLFWVAYPKGSSKRYKCDFNRDKGWDILGELGYEGVRQVAIDEDWSALRFRKASFIKSLTRSDKMALSREGKERVNEKNFRN